MEIQIDIRARTRDDMAIAHDRAALHRAVVARVNAVIVRVVGTKIVTELVSDHIDIPVARIRGHCISE